MRRRGRGLGFGCGWRGKAARHSLGKCFEGIAVFRLIEEEYRAGGQTLPRDTTEIVNA